MERVTVSTGDLDLSVTVEGDPDAPTLLMLHGWPASARTFFKLSPFLSGRYRLVMPDQRGFGRSDKPVGTANYSMSNLLGDALALIRWSGAERVGIVGHDLGGAVSWALGALAPQHVHAMVVMCSPHPLHFKRVAAASPEQVQRAFYVWLMHAGEAGERLLGRGDFGDLSAWVFGASSVSAEDRAAYRREWSQPGAFTAMAEWYRALYTPDLLNPEVPLELAPVAVPTRYLAAERDPAFASGMDSGSGDFVDAPYDEQVVGGTSHWVADDAPERIAALIDDWMRRYP